jgi:hypothetical protein
MLDYMGVCNLDGRCTDNKKITQYLGSMYGGDIMGELETKKEFVAPPTEYPLTMRT